MGRLKGMRFESWKTRSGSDRLPVTLRRFLFAFLCLGLLTSMVPVTPVQAIRIDDPEPIDPDNPGSPGPGGSGVTYVDVPIPDQNGNILGPNQTFRKIEFSYTVTNVFSVDPNDLLGHKTFERYILHEVRPADNATIPVNICNARSYALGYTLASAKQDELELNSEDQQATGQTDMPFQVSSFLNLAGDVERSDRNKYSTVGDLPVPPNPPGSKGETTRWNPRDQYLVTVSWESFPPPDTTDESTIARTTVKNMTTRADNDINAFGENVGSGNGEFVAVFRTLMQGKFRFGSPVMRFGTNPDTTNRIFPSYGADYSDITTNESEVVTFNPAEYTTTCDNPRVVERLYNTCSCQFVGTESFLPGAPPRFCETTKPAMVDAAEFWPPWVLIITVPLIFPFPIIETHTKVNSFNDIMAIMAILGDAQRREEVVELNVSPRNPMPGEKTTVSANPNGFETSKGVYSAFCLDGISQQGALAGGFVRTAFELNQNGEKRLDDAGADYPLVLRERQDGRTCCNPITRRPEVDIDNDGIDDAWETFYVDKMKTLYGTEAVSAYIPDRFSLEQWENLPPDGDFDGDGYLARDFEQRGNFYDPVTLEELKTFFNNTPLAKRFSDGSVLAPGDGSYSNLEEYLWGTDPTEKDTDGDGYPDEADLLGLKQNTFDFPFMKLARKFTPDVFGLRGDRHQLRVTILGGSTKQRDQSKKRVMIGSKAQNVFARPAQELGITVLSVPSAPRYKSPFIVRVDGSNPDYPLDTLDVKWFFTTLDHVSADPVTQPEQFYSFPPPNAAPEDRSRVVLNMGGERGRTAPDDRLSIDTLSEKFEENGWSPLTPGSTIVAKAVVYDARYAQSATSGTVITLGEDDISFSYCQPSPADGICSWANPADQVPDNQINFLYTAEDNEIGVLVEIELSDAYAERKGELLYEWEVNGEKLERSCGPDGQEMCGIGSYRMKFLPRLPTGDPYTIGVGVYDQESRRVLETVIRIPTTEYTPSTVETEEELQGPGEREIRIQIPAENPDLPSLTRKTVDRLQASVADFLTDPWMRLARFLGVLILAAGLAYGGVRLGKILGSVS